METTRVYLVASILVGASVAVSGLSAASAQTGALARKAMLGVAIETVAGGARVLQVNPGSTAAQAGIRTGDVITAVNGATVTDTIALVARADELRSGQPVSLSYLRQGKASSGEALAVARPMESYERAKATYGAVAFRGGLLRNIMVTPDTAKKNGPVVYLLQGYYCATMEGPNAAHPYRALAQGLADRGIATYRVEKPGMGDSQGGPSCFDMDFDAELSAFREGLRTLINIYGVAPSRIVLLGHSMGGVEAPVLAAETPGLRGLAVYGTVMRNWHDYMQDLFRLQSLFSVGADPADNEALAEAMRPILNRIFMEEAPLKQIASEITGSEQLLREALWWDGEDQILGRSVAYWRGVGQQRLAAAWRDANAPTLAVYGQVDYAAIDDRDHRLIVDVVNHYRPGTASYAMLARTGHGFGLEGAPEEARAANRAAGGQVANAAYNPELTKVLADWIAGLPAPS